MDTFVDNIKRGGSKDPGKVNSADTAAQMFQLQMLGGMTNNLKGGNGLAGAFGPFTGIPVCHHKSSAESR